MNHRAIGRCVLIMMILVLFSGCIGDGERATSTSSTQPELFVYSGAGLRLVMDEIAEEFEKEAGTNVRLEYGGAGELLSKLEIMQTGDVFIPGARPPFEKAKEKGFVEDEDLVAYHIPVIAVPRGNPANITCLEDLAREDVKIALGDPEAVPIGRAADKILKKAGIRDDVNVVTLAGTEPAIHADIIVGRVDAAIVWRSSVWKAKDKIEIIEIPKEENEIKIIPIGVVRFSENRETAAEFIDFVISDRAKGIWEANGYVTYPNEEYET